MHLAPVFLVFISLAAAQAGVFEEQVRLIAHPGPGTDCPTGLQIRGVLPTLDHGEDSYRPEDALSTVLLTDQLHMNRLFHIFERIQNSQLHALPHRRMDTEHTAFSAWRVFARNLLDHTSFDTYQMTYVTAAFGDDLLYILERDNDNADLTADLLEVQGKLLRRMAYAVKYFYAWRQVFKDMYPGFVQRGNRGFADIMNEWRQTYAQYQIANKLSAVTRETETGLRKDLSGMFSPAAIQRPPLTLENWNTRFPARYLPVIGQRAIEYLRQNLEFGPVRWTPTYLAILNDLATDLEAYDQRVDRARQKVMHVRVRYLQQSQ